MPPAPADGLYDDSSILREEQRAAAVEAVSRARASGVDLYIALFGYIIGETIEQRAERFKAAWCPDGSGLLVVADTSTNQCTYLSHVDATEWLSAAELQRIFTEAGAAGAAAKGTSADKVLALITDLASRLSGAMASHKELTRHRAGPRVWLIFGAVALTAIVLGVLGFLGRWLLMRHRRATGMPPLYFPTVTVGERFGGPFGGGVIAEVTFHTPQAP